MMQFCIFFGQMSQFKLGKFSLNKLMQVNTYTHCFCITYNFSWTSVQWVKNLAEEIQ